MTATARRPLGPALPALRGLLALVALVALVAVAAVPAQAGLDARMMRFPDVSATQVAFAYAGDIWVAPKEGGLATRLSTPPGDESYPRFSPDGKSLAFSAGYDGNVDVYVMPVAGGVPVRLTHHPMYDRGRDWTPDGSGVLFVSGRDAGRDRYEQFYVVPKVGGMPERLPVPYGSYGTLSADGKTIAYTMHGRENSTWKRYRGGWNSEIWIYGLRDNRSERISAGTHNDFQPVFAAGKLWFLSDRGDKLRANLWVRDLATGSTRQVTNFTEQDARFPSAGPSEIVFEHEGHLKLMDLASEQVRVIDISVQTDLATLKPRAENVSGLITSASASPSGKRIAVVARGDIFSVPSAEGVITNLTHSPGTYERFASWSPDGKTLACWTDKTGEYELSLRPADGGEEKIVTSLGPGFRYSPWWSPDSKKIAFVEQTMRIRVLDLASGKVTDIDRGIDFYEGGLRGFRPSWSADSRWLAWSRSTETAQSAIFLWDSKDGKTTQATSGFSGEYSPVFDPEGKYLWLFAARSFQPSYSDFDNAFVYSNATQVACIPLRKDVASPLAPKNDVEDGKKDDDDEGDEDEDEDEGKPKSGDRSKPGKKGEKSKAEGKGKDKDKKDAAPEPVTIDLDGFEQRLVVLPGEPGNYADLGAVPGKVVYRRGPRTGSGGKTSPVLYFDLEKREEKTILDDAQSFEITSLGEKALASKDGGLFVVAVEEGQKLEKKAPTDGLESTVDPRAEWRQIFNDAWRLERDFFYDPGMHGVDWPAMKERYGALLDHAVTRADVNFVLGELIGELSSSHAYRWGGDLEEAPSRNVGLPGCDFALENGRYRITRIIDGAAWDSQTRSPLAMPGVEVKEGDYLLAVNGAEIDVTKDPYAAFAGLANATVELTVSAKPSFQGSRKVVVKLLESEERLRQLAWVEANRKHVEERSGGKIGYLYVQDTGIDGQTDLVRMFYGEHEKQALLVDERFNSGGQIPDRFVELLNRPVTNYWGVRDGRDWRWPPMSHMGPKAMLINGWSGSGGDCFPFFFKEAGLGPLIGRRTWGGLIGISGSPDLIDGGLVTVPTFAIYSPEGEWIIENRGVDPDIEVIDDPALMREGGDPQLDKAVDWLLAELAKNPPVRPKRPSYPVK